MSKTRSNGSEKENQDASSVGVIYGLSRYS